MHYLFLFIFGYFRAVAYNETSNLGLHTSMFQHTVATQMNDEQQAKWIPALKNYELIGTYAQTELGHGTL